VDFIIIPLFFETLCLRRFPYFFLPFSEFQGEHIYLTPGGGFGKFLGVSHQRGVTGGGEIFPPQKI